MSFKIKVGLLSKVLGVMLKSLKQKWFVFCNLLLLNILSILLSLKNVHAEQ